MRAHARIFPSFVRSTREKCARACARAHERGHAMKRGLQPDSRCPGSGMRMISRTYTIRNIEAADCEQWEWRAQRAEARGDSEEAQALTDSLAKWEKEQGQERERLVCAVCQSAWLKPTAAWPIWRRAANSRS